jgi:hypothetical protein
MGELAKSILGKAHATNPYDGFDASKYPIDLQGTGATPMLQKVFDAINPRVIVEVGTWKGASAVFFAQLLKDRGIDGVVICVDTWLGGFHSMSIRENKPGWQEGWEIEKYYHHGYPTLYYQFLANVVHKGLQDYIVPVPNTSQIAARWLHSQRIGADVIYVDGSHDEDDVYRDLVDYWKVLNLNGIMCGDDFTSFWYGVICAVNRFARENDVTPQVIAPTWALQKTLKFDQQLVLGLARQEIAQAMKNKG